MFVTLTIHLPEASEPSPSTDHRDPDAEEPDGEQPQARVAESHGESDDEGRDQQEEGRTGLPREQESRENESGVEHAVQLALNSLDGLRLPRGYGAVAAVEQETQMTESGSVDEPAVVSAVAR